jgi:hypothetical protein
LVPEASTPAKLATSIEETTLWEKFAVTETLLSGLGEKARQISEVPICVLVRTTSVHVKFAPVMLVTVMFVPLASVATNAKSNSLPDAVENAPLFIDVNDVV